MKTLKTLETIEISKSYRGRRVVDDVSVHVSRGEIVGLLGPNGAGKTTSFYMVVGLISPDSGKVLLDGVDLTGMPMFQRAPSWHQLSAAGSVGVSQADGGREPDGDPADAPHDQHASGATR